MKALLLRMSPFFLIISILLTLSSCGDNNTHRQRLVPNSNELKQKPIDPGKIYSMFSPWEGEKAFATTYKMIESATSYVHVTVYSWKDKDFDKALLKALSNNSEVKVRLVLHPALARKKSLQKRIKALEAAGVMIKRHTKNMHEKFTIVDGIKAVNSSANFSSGAKTRYSENFLFFESVSAGDTADKAIKALEREFKFLWNSSKDVITHGEGVESPLSQEQGIVSKVSESSHFGFYSSSMNFHYSKSEELGADITVGRYLKMSAKKIDGVKSWTVRDRIIKSIRNAKHSVTAVLNHFNIKDIEIELIEAVKRGVDVKLYVDNQEYIDGVDTKEMTPNFVADWRALGQLVAGRPSPVRVKFYSHAPSPRYWLLNHHKFFIFDHGNHGSILTGSYNVSKNAEHKQFDNMIFLKGQAYIAVLDSYQAEFEKLWSLGRDEFDRPSNTIYDSYLLSKNDDGVYILHHSKAISLSFSEIKSLKDRVKELAPAIFDDIYKHKGCKYFRALDSQYVSYDWDTDSYKLCK
ncbi:MAG: phosphatidylserine/phosphatidylglycerophosphate/cardiolipin synthase family protein [Bacteriovoracaceae bacterium]|jgi:phosphatidylserine/phosphatidylglycerophosphate/cardiolipin synthase-like enzyme|nr:phosphatidylserine/phosphatidylglycerophosphate/cardiolipin synthase family protein [Bacteriovoracaceae bacterium]